MPLAWRALRPSVRYDTVITSHHAFATQNTMGRHAERHLAYVHSPARYVWSPELDPRGYALPVRVLRPLLKQVDLRAARQLTSVAANSNEVARRIRHSWGLEAAVLPPPVDTTFFLPGSDPSVNLPFADGYLLGFSRWIEYKRLDLVVAAGERLGVPVIIAGSGPLASDLRALAREASVPVVLVERPDDRTVRELMRRAIAFVFPTVEDFGIVPVEAQACGTPVVAPRLGGVLDTVADGESGVLVDSLEPVTLARAVAEASVLSADACRANAERFSRASFADAFHEWASV